MNKTTSLVLIGLLVLSLSAIAETYPIGYKDKYCTEEWVKHGWHWEWEEVCITKDRETSVYVPRYDDSGVKDSITEIEETITTNSEAWGRDSSGISRSSVWKILLGDYFTWLKDQFVLKSEFEEYKLEQEQVNKELYKRVFTCEKEIGLTKGYR